MYDLNDMEFSDGMSSQGAQEKKKAVDKITWVTETLIQKERESSATVFGGQAGPSFDSERYEQFYRQSHSDFFAMKTDNSTFDVEDVRPTISESSSLA